VNGSRKNNAHKASKNNFQLELSKIRYSSSRHFQESERKLNKAQYTAVAENVLICGNIYLYREIYVSV
jgi:hypothetical protein